MAFLFNEELLTFLAVLLALVMSKQNLGIRTDLPVVPKGEGILWCILQKGVEQSPLTAVFEFTNYCVQTLIFSSGLLSEKDKGIRLIQIPVNIY